MFSSYIKTNQQKHKVPKFRPKDSEDYEPKKPKKPNRKDLRDSKRSWVE